MGQTRACQRTSLDRRSFKKQKPVFCYDDSVMLRIFGSDHVLQSRESFLDRIIPKDLVNGSDLVVNFVHKDLCLKDGFQISPVDQVKVSFKGMWICKE